MAKISATSSGRLFLTLFLGEGPFPKVIQGITRGQAISLCQKLNMYHHRWAKEENRELLQLSAKAKGELSTPEDWRVEVSFSPKNSGETSRAAVGWMEALHEQLKAKEQQQQQQQIISAKDGIQEDNPL